MAEFTFNLLMDKLTSLSVQHSLLPRPAVTTEESIPLLFLTGVCLNVYFHKRAYPSADLTNAVYFYLIQFSVFFLYAHKNQLTSLYLLHWEPTLPNRLPNSSYV